MIVILDVVPASTTIEYRSLGEAADAHVFEEGLDDCFLDHASGCFSFSEGGAEEDLMSCGMPEAVNLFQAMLAVSVPGRCPHEAPERAAAALDDALPDAALWQLVPTGPPGTEAMDPLWATRAEENEECAMTLETIPQRHMYPDTLERNPGAHCVREIQPRDCSLEGHHQPYSGSFCTASVCSLVPIRRNPSGSDEILLSSPSSSVSNTEAFCSSSSETSFYQQDTVNLEHPLEHNCLENPRLGGAPAPPLPPQQQGGPGALKHLQTAKGPPGPAAPRMTRRRSSSLQPITGYISPWWSTYRYCEKPCVFSALKYCRGWGKGMPSRSALMYHPRRAVAGSPPAFCRGARKWRDR